MAIKEPNRRSCIGIAVATAALVMLSDCTVSPSPSNNSVTPSPTAAVQDSDITPHSVGTTLQFECENPIAAGSSVEGLGGGLAMLGVPDVMAINSGSIGAQEILQWGAGVSYQGLQFTKVGLILKAGTAFTLNVPAQMRGAMKIGWSNSGYTLADELVIPGCNSNQTNEGWLVYPGGFWLKEPGCVPLEVTAGKTSQTIHIPIGKPCR